ncbi:MAG TPA: biotin--[acetyl-CoA-carboxylase] ligase [Gemmatimonadales bacterium]|nr:biotin--[acetyl-CoA-carboxylase] ligase [Gemmatimonadales bacterium]
MIHHHQDLPSTMDEAHRLAAAGAAHGDAVTSRRQGAGRGRHGKQWSSGDGGLWVSVIGRPDPAQQLEPLSLRVGIAVAHTLESALPSIGTIGLKWPNDLLVYGRKVGGVLTEARWIGGQCRWVVTGVGINVRNAIPNRLYGIAIALSEVDPGMLPEHLLEPVVAAVAGALAGGELDREELHAWRDRDVLAGRRIETPVQGTVEGIDPMGGLLVRDPDGELHRASTGLVALTD